MTRGGRPEQPLPAWAAADPHCKPARPTAIRVGAVVLPRTMLETGDPQLARPVLLLYPILVRPLLIRPPQCQVTRTGILSGASMPARYPDRSPSPPRPLSLTVRAAARPLLAHAVTARPVCRSFRAPSGCPLSVSPQLGSCLFHADLVAGAGVPKRFWSVTMVESQMYKYQQPEQLPRISNAYQRMGLTSCRSGRLSGAE